MQYSSSKLLLYCTIHYNLDYPITAIILATHNLQLVNPHLNPNQLAKHDILTVRITGFVHLPSGGSLASLFNVVHLIKMLQCSSSEFLPCCTIHYNLEYQIRAIILATNNLQLVNPSSTPINCLHLTPFYWSDYRFPPGWSFAIVLPFTR